MTSRTRFLGTALTLAFALALVPLASPAQAQMMGETSKWSIDGRGGIAVPAGDLSDAVDVGPTFGLGIAYRVHPRVSIRVDGDVDVYSGADVQTAAGTVELPDLNLWHYNAGVGVELTEPGASRWDVTANVGAGATTFDGDAFTTNGTTVDGLSETYFTANGGLKFGYDVSRNVNVYAGGQWYLAFTDEEDTAGLTPGGQQGSGLDTASSIPLTLGLKLKF